MNSHKRGIEMTIGGVVAFRRELARSGHENAREFAAFMVAKLEMELADHMDDVREATERLRLRTDEDGQAMLRRDLVRSTALYRRISDRGSNWRRAR